LACYDLRMNPLGLAPASQIRNANRVWKQGQCPKAKAYFKPRECLVTKTFVADKHAVAGPGYDLTEVVTLFVCVWGGGLEYHWKCWMMTVIESFSIYDYSNKQFYSFDDIKIIYGIPQCDF